MQDTGSGCTVSDYPECIVYGDQKCWLATLADILILIETKNRAWREDGRKGRGAEPRGVAESAEGASPPLFESGGDTPTLTTKGGWTTNLLVSSSVENRSITATIKHTKTVKGRSLHSLKTAPKKPDAVPGPEAEQ